ncbi:hypothetical protein TNCV_3661231 [Trichonephila clavipes]|nr:hypothetical protein TNCV_3661231 [Trichonephila clavipes]
MNAVQRGRCWLNMSRLKRSPVGVLWKLGVPSEIVLEFLLYVMDMTRRRLGVMVTNSWSEGRGFECWCHRLEGTDIHYLMAWCGSLKRSASSSVVHLTQTRFKITMSGAYIFRVGLLCKVNITLTL